MPASAPLPALPMPRGVLHASMISASAMVVPSELLIGHICSRSSVKVNSRARLPPFTRLPRAKRQNLLGRPQVRLVDHLAVDLDNAGSRIVAKGFDDLLRPGDLFIGRHEGRIDDIDMLGMDHRLGQETILTRGNRLLPQGL